MKHIIPLILLIGCAPETLNRDMLMISVDGRVESTLIAADYTALLVAFQPPGYICTSEPAHREIEPSGFPMSYHASSFNIEQELNTWRLVALLSKLDLETLRTSGQRAYRKGDPVYFSDYLVLDPVPCIFEPNDTCFSGQFTDVDIRFDGTNFWPQDACPN